MATIHKAAEGRVRDARTLLRTLTPQDPTDTHISVDIPASLLPMLRDIIGSIAAEQTITIVPESAELSTQQAADLLKVSRPFLIRLLDEERILYRRVGTHRRVDAQSLLQYREQSLSEQRSAAQKLTELTEELGLY